MKIDLGLVGYGWSAEAVGGEELKSPAGVFPGFGAVGWQSGYSSQAKSGVAVPVVAAYASFFTAGPVLTPEGGLGKGTLSIDMHGRVTTVPEGFNAELIVEAIDIDKFDVADLNAPGVEIGRARFPSQGRTSVSVPVDLAGFDPAGPLTIRFKSTVPGSGNVQGRIYSASLDVELASQPSEFDKLKADTGLTEAQLKKIIAYVMAQMGFSA
jgi:hypothetical protein